MMHTKALVSGLAILGVAWLGPLPGLAQQSFAAHMTMHMLVVALAAPLVAIAVSDTRFDPVRATPRLLAPMPASIVELVVVWAWHAPVLHHAARQHASTLVLEQASFLIAGLILWIAAVGGDRHARRLRAGAGVVALLFTSMHMTLLGALFALANRPLFVHASSPQSALSPMQDQQLGGAIMLLAGGASYLVGGVWLTTRVLRGSAVRGTS